MTEIIDNITKSLKLLKTENEVVELRILKTANQGTVSGYFNDYQALAKQAASFDGEVPGIYITLNPVKEELLTTNLNRTTNWAKKTTSDQDIAKRRFFPIDLDPIRKSGVSATNEEFEEAKKLGVIIKEALEKKGWPAPIVASSGNGTHLLYAINLPNDNDSRELVKQGLESLDFRYSNNLVDVDTSVSNSARIFKLYGTKACKGENTDERPHRYSSILEAPENLEIVTKKQLQELANEVETVKKSSATIPNIESKNSFVLNNWLNKHGIKVASTRPWQNSSMKYVLETCPWNEEHNDRSAYIIQFADGAIAAGCHHNSCSNENWQSLRLKYEPNYKSSKKKEEKPKMSDVLIELSKEAKFFLNDLEEACAAIEVNGHTEIWKIKSKIFKLWLTKQYFDETKSAPSVDAMNQALNVLEMSATFNGEKHKLQLRVAEHEGKFYYDLSDKDWKVVEISPTGPRVLENPPILFSRNKNMKGQVEPNFDGDIRLLLNHVRLKHEDDQILYLVYVISCLIPNIPHTVIVYSGEKGASKSTSMKMTRQIIDPAVRDLLTMPNSIQDLAISLSNNYMPCFDNLDSLSAAKSDLLCIASTGGGFSKRTLFTDDDETLLELHRCPALNGINVVVTRADLMDRSIVLELERIPEEERKEERVVREAFEKDRADIIGGALNILSKAMTIYPNVQLNKLSRMADFMRWGYAISEAMGYGGERFLKAYHNNQNSSNEEAISSHPVAATIVLFMRNRSVWKGSVADLLRQLEFTAGQEKIDTNMKTWPKAAHILSRRLKEVKSNLAEKGITFSIRPAGDSKEITIQSKRNKEEEKQNVEELGLKYIEPEDVELTPGYDEFASFNLM